MKKLYILLILTCSHAAMQAQVKPTYLYNNGMAYGTLDIRTTITSTNYYYLKEGSTFAYREKSPGVKTNTYRDMTTFESNPYLQGHLRWKNGTSDKFVMNYRLLMPVGYKSTYTAGYPLIVILHGGGERGNCFYNSCFHADWNYDPNVNSPKAPTAGDHKLLNNDYHLAIGGKQHLDARNLAGSRLPHDATMPSRAFPGFVLVCQMLNEWNPKTVEDMIRVVRLHCQKYKIDQNRVYIHGLSIGGYATYEAIKRAPWLFAAALPISATTDAGITAKNLQGKTAHIPLWVFQGGKDTNPTPAATKSLITKFQAAGSIVKYTEYPTLGHAVWNNAYADPAFFSWMLSKNNSNIHLYKGNKVIVRAQKIFPKLMLPAGFFAYQWQRNGVALSNTTNVLSVTTAGTYRARFSRVANPATNQWNRWSANVAVTEGTATSSSIEEEEIIVSDLEEAGVEIFPNPSTADNLNLEISDNGPYHITLVDPLGREVYQEDFDATEPVRKMNVQKTLSDGLYILVIERDGRKFTKRVFIRN